MSIRSEILPPLNTAARADLVGPLAGGFRTPCFCSCVCDAGLSRVGWDELAVSDGDLCVTKSTKDHVSTTGFSLDGSCRRAPFLFLFWVADCLGMV